MKAGKFPGDAKEGVGEGEREKKKSETTTIYDTIWLSHTWLMLYSIQFKFSI